MMLLDLSFLYGLYFTFGFSEVSFMIFFILIYYYTLYYN